MKKIIIMLSFVMFFSAAVFSVNAFANDWGAIDDLHYEITENNEIAITAYYGNEKKLIIPSYIEGYPVTELDEKFSFNDNMESIVIPPTISKIECYFGGSEKFENIYVSDLEAWCSIDFCSYSTESLNLYLNDRLVTDLVIPESVTVIKPNVFSAIKSIKTVTIHENVSDIGKWAFYLCDNIEKVYINDLKCWCEIDFGSVESNPLYYADKLYVNGVDVSDYVYIPDGTTQIKNYAFWGFKGLKAVNIPYSVNDISPMAFTECTSLSKITVNNTNNVYSSENGVLFNKNKTTLFCYPAGKSDATYTVPNSVSVIGAGSIRSTVYLKHLIIGDSVTTIELTTICESETLETVTFGKGIKSIDRYVFNACPNLKKIIITDMDAWCKTNISLVFYLFNDTRSLYYNGEPLKTLIIPESVTEINKYTFAGCKSLESVVLHDKITKINSYAFSGATNIKNVSFTGDEQSKADIQIANGNEAILNITWNFNACSNGGQHIYDNRCDTDCNLCKKIREIEHDFTWITDKKENCGDNGIKHEECSVCKEKRNENTLIEATGNHSFDNACDAECNVCKQTREIKHSFAWIIDKKENCGDDGFKHEECSVCKEKRNENTLIEATGNHSFDNACDAECNVCKQTREIKHSFAWIIDKKENCGNDGIKHEECSVCYITKNENTKILATGDHTFDNEEDSQCNVCGITREAGHNFIWIIDKEPACNVDGYKHEQCTICSEVRSENTIIPALQHTMSNWTVSKKESCEIKGEETRKCVLCGLTEAKEIPALVHNFVLSDSSKQPTCTEDGAEITVCTACGKESKTVIKATGHTYGEWTVTEEATYDKTGLKRQICSECGDSKEEIIPVLKPAETSETEISQPQTEQPKNNNLWWIVTPIISVLVVLFVVFLIIKKKKQDKYTRQT